MKGSGGLYDVLVGGLVFAGAGGVLLPGEGLLFALPKNKGHAIVM